MSPAFVLPRPARIGFPRVSGDELDLVKVGPAVREFSPRERG